MHLRTSLYDCCPESQYFLQHFVCIQPFCRSRSVRKNKPDIPIRSSVSARKQNGRRCFIPTSAQKRQLPYVSLFCHIKNKENITVSIPQTPIASPLMAPSVSPSSMALDVPIA